MIPLSTLNKRTYHSIDLLKVVASLLVVAIHARPFEGDHYPLFISLFSRMAVPTFFVVSAFFFFRKSPDGAQLKRYLKRMASFSTIGVWARLLSYFCATFSSIPPSPARGLLWH